MTTGVFAGIFAGALSLTMGLAASDALAQAAKQAEFEPQSGQAGKDVVWVPTPDELVQKMLDMAKVTKRDFVIDLGSGDGRTVIAAARRGARAQGIEYNPEMVSLSQRNAEKAGVTANATFAKQDLFQSDFSKATVITMFLLSDINMKLRPKILSLKPGTRIVSNTFKMGDWEPDQTGDAAGCSTWCSAHLWIVPAKVDGKWKTGQGELAFKQEFQKLSGTIGLGGNAVAIASGRLNGSEITFVAGTSEYRGKVNGSSMEGTVTSDGKESAWKATR
ncbi:MAG: class I SAM-dependent methyltransferase [Betaproteobacteria bacterium]|nr:class I SAM-dependent methyltransferase [Betaproteobacteria bacterium]